MAASPLAAFVADVEQLLDDPHAVGRRLRALLGQEDCLPAAQRVLDGEAYRHHMLYVSPNHRVSVVVLMRLPGRHTLVHHDDGPWRVTGVLEGCERETCYRVVERDGRHSLTEIASFDARAGHVEVVLPAEELLRTTAAVGDRPAISIHVCCTHVKRPARRVLVTPTVVEVARAGRPRG